MTKNSKQPLYMIFLILIIGCILGSAISNFVIAILPEGNVLEFFKLKSEIGFNDTHFDFEVIKFTLGFKFDVSILSILGMAVSWYFLRYFK